MRYGLRKIVQDNLLDVIRMATKRCHDWRSDVRMMGWQILGSIVPYAQETLTAHVPNLMRHIRNGLQDDTEDIHVKVV